MNAIRKGIVFSLRFFLLAAVLYSDTANSDRLEAPQLRGLNRGVWPIPASSLSRNRTWAAQCLHAAEDLGFTKLSLAALYFSIPTLEPARARVAGTEAGSGHAGARPNPFSECCTRHPTPYLLTLIFPSR